jgi:hypothetical protein
MTKSPNPTINEAPTLDTATPAAAPRHAVPLGGASTAVIAMLSKLRQTYLKELQAGREKAKKNFMR